MLRTAWSRHLRKEYARRVHSHSGFDPSIPLVPYFPDKNATYKSAIELVAIQSSMSFQKAVETETIPVWSIVASRNQAQINRNRYRFYSIQRKTDDECVPEERETMLIWPSVTSW